MSLLDIFFPEQAQAIHLRTLAEQAQSQSYEAQRERHSLPQVHESVSFENQRVDQQVEKLERDLGKASLVIEALLELLEEQGVFTRAEVVARIGLIDSRDGTVDGRINTAATFKPNRPWPGDAGTA